MPRGVSTAELPKAPAHLYRWGQVGLSQLPDVNPVFTIGSHPALLLKGEKEQADDLPQSHLICKLQEIKRTSIRAMLGNPTRKTQLKTVSTQRRDSKNHRNTSRSISTSAWLLGWEWGHALPRQQFALLLLQQPLLLSQRNKSTSVLQNVAFSARGELRLQSEK